MIKLNDTILVIRNARDKVQFAQYILEQEANIYTIKRFTGQFGGKITTQPEIIIEKGKVKRSALQQAELQYNALIKTATDKGYKKFTSLTKTKWEEVTNIELNEIVPSLKTDATGALKPQLAKSSNDCAISVFDKPMFVSRKIDGIRCLMRYNEEEDCILTSSRGGGEFDVSTTAIREDGQLLDLFRKNPTLILDGELYVHGWSLQRISGTCRLKTWEERCNALEYWVFDYVDTEKSFNNRLDFLTDIKIDFESGEGNKKVKVLEHELAEGWDKYKYLHNKYVSEGYEGLVARKPNAVYGCGKRSSDWIKLKDRLEDEFEIVGIEEGLRPEDMCFKLITKEGKEFKAKPVGSRELREEYLENWEELVGKKASVTFFIWSKDLIPQQPVLKCIRDYE